MKIFALMLSILFVVGCDNDQTIKIENSTPETTQAPKKEFSQKFKNIGLKTNTDIHSIPLEEVIGGGPKKDGIPALNDPQDWESITEAGKWINDDHLGVLVEFEEVQRFYPYDILYWHEIVNDTVGTQNFTVTFCPLCGSVVVFNREVDGEIINFGVSGKLWESNLLMYDNQTESLWSQILGEAKVGDQTGKTLEILPKNILTFGDLRKNFTNVKVLSRPSQYHRPYGTSPYGNYEINRSIMFPVKNEADDTTVIFHPKELFHIINLDEKTAVGFQREQLLAEKIAEIKINDVVITAKVSDDKTIAFQVGDRMIPDYVAMWFSWQTHQDREKVVWPQ